VIPDPPGWLSSCAAKWVLVLGSATGDGASVCSFFYNPPLGVTALPVFQAYVQQFGDFLGGTPLADTPPAA